MPRRKGRSGAGGDGPAAKKSRTDLPEIDGYIVQWEWEGDKKKLMGFEFEHACSVTDAYNNGDDNVILNLAAGVQVKIIFDKMVQKNTKTGWERRLSCCVLDKKSDSYYCWCWQDEKNNWNFFNTKTVIELENSYNSDQSDVSLTACGRAYTVNVTKMEQKNDVTEVIRKVQRMKSSVVAPGPKKSNEEEENDDIEKAIDKGIRQSPRKSGVKTAIKKEEVEEDEEEDVKPSTSKGKAASGRGKSAARAKKGENGTVEKSTVRTVIVKGKAPVDPECTLVGKAHVMSEGNNVWDCMLNQTNLQNNNNKYYLIQILEDDKAKKFSVWMRWGRVGKTGQNALIPCGPNLEEAKKVFCRKFSDKTKNDWSTRKNFTKVPGKYDLVEMDYDADDTPAPDSLPKKDVNVPDSKLEKKLQDLINLICDVKSMEETVMEMKYDAKKAPLGKLKSSQMKAGYAALKKIDHCITNNNMGRNLIEACDEFYTRIPHDFGMRQPPVIRTKQEVKAKLGLLEALSDIEVAMTIIKKSVLNENPIDTHYDMLDCALEPMDKSDDMYKILDKYLQNTHAPTHNQYTMNIMDVFEVDKSGADSNFIDKGNRTLLWHGSRLTNWVGILSQGLRIAPPEAPVTGYMFGKGVYFADMSSKSANYCYPTRAKNIGLLLLCEVSLGDCNELLNADYKADKLPADKHSVWGKGRVVPDPAQAHTLDDGTIVPLGKHKDSKLVNPTGYTLNYNEFIVYDVKQIKMKYLLKIKYNFK